MKVNQIKLGAILSYAVVGLNIIVGLGYTPILIRMLGQSDYGLYSMVSSIISYLTVLDLGFGNAIIIYTARYRVNKQKDKEHQLYGMFLIIYTIIGIVATIIGIILYFNVGNLFSDTMSAEEIAKAKIMMILLTINLAVTFPFSIFGNVLVAYEKFVISKIIKILQIILTPCIMIPLLFLGYKSIALIIVTTLVNVLCLLLNTVICFKELKIKFKFTKFDFKVLKEIFGYSFFIFLNQVIDKVNWSVDQFVLGAVSGTVAVSVYSIAAQLNNMYMAFSTAISGVLLPRVTAMEERKASDEEFTDIFIKTGRIQYFVMALIITGFIMFGQKFIQIWAGSGYEKSYIIACILMIPATIPLIQNIGLSILQAKNKYKYRTIIFFFIAIFNIIISIPLAKKFEGIGSAIGTSIALILGQIIFLNIYYHKSVKINMIKFWKEIIKMTIPLFLSFIIYWGVISYINTDSIILIGLEILIYILIYSWICWKFIMNEYEKEIIRKPLRRLKIIK